MTNNVIPENTNPEIQRLEIEVRIAELNAQKSEARLRTLEAEEKVREIQIRRAKAAEKVKSDRDN
jgi:hypothetical protein